MLPVPQQEKVEGGRTIWVTCEKGFQQTTLVDSLLECAGRSISPCEWSVYHVSLNCMATLRSPLSQLSQRTPLAVFFG